LADLSHLGGLQAITPLDLENYAEVKESTFRLPPAGKYLLRAPESFPSAAFGRTAKGALSVQIDPTIAAGEFEGFTVKFVKVSGKTFDRSGQQVSQLGDYLISCGVRAKLTNEQEMADAVEATAGALYEAKLDWRAYNKNTGFSLEGMQRFPKLEDGSYQSWVSDPNDYEVDETGQIKTDKSGNKINKRVRANLMIAFGGFIPKA
jgi:hypothetical protein